MTRLFQGIEDFGGACAVVAENGRTVSYRDLASLADATAQEATSHRGPALLELGNDLTSLAAFIGACRAGVPVLPIRPGADRTRADLIARLRPGSVFSRAEGFRALPADDSGQAHPPHRELAILLPTSGTTGCAKLVRLSHRNMVANAESISSYLQIDKSDRAATVLPLHYSFGLSIVTSHLLSGASLLLTDGSVLDPGFREVFQSGGASSFSGVPRTFEILQRTGFLDEPLPGLRTVTQAGGRLAPHLVEAMLDYTEGQGARFFVMYGQTEAAPRMSYMTPQDARRHPDAIGEAVPGGQFRLLGSDGRQIDAPNTAGELCYRGPNVMMGYAQERACLARGYDLQELHTGDIAERLEDGAYRIVGRAARFVKVAGVRIGLDPVEASLQAEGLCCGATGTDDGIIVGVEGRAADARRLASRLASRWDVPAIAVTVVSYKALPSLSSGKPDYARIAEDGAAAARGRSGGDLRTRLGAILDRDDLGDDETFFSAGGDSLGYIEASIAVEEVYGHLVPGWERIPFGLLCSGLEPAAGVSDVQDALPGARSIAIGLAMISHAFIQFGVWGDLPTALRLVTRVATPSFLVLFGLGLARSFVDRPEARLPGRLYRRFLPRALWIYLVAVMIQGCAVIVGDSVPSGALRAMLWSGPGRFVNLLMVYCLLYLVAPLAVAALERWRGAALAIMLALPWALRPWLVALADPPYVVGYLTGAGGLFGPSLLHATTFVLAGYILGAARRRREFAIIGGIGAIAGVILTAAMLQGQGPTDWIAGIASGEWRRGNHPAFYLYGIAGAGIIFGLGAWVGRVRSHRRLHALATGLGENTIFAFGFGNMVLNLVGPHDPPPAVGIVLTVAFVGTLSLLTRDVMRSDPQMFGPMGRGLRKGMLFLLDTGRRLTGTSSFSRHRQ